MHDGLSARPVEFIVADTLSTSLRGLRIISAAAVDAGEQPG
jgi:hypothetical protein